MKFGKKLFALLLALIMVVSLIPTIVFAETPVCSGDATGCAHGIHIEPCPLAFACAECGLTDGHTDICSIGLAEKAAAEAAAAARFNNVQNLMNALPTTVDADNVDSVEDQMAAIDEAKKDLTAAQIEALDKTIWNASKSAYDTYMGNPNASIPDTGDDTDPVYDDVYTNYIVVEVANQTELDAAVAAATEKTLLKLASGTYTFYNNSSYANKKLVFKGTSNVVIDGTKLGNEVYGDELTFDNVTFNFPNASHKGITHTNKVVFNNCKFTGTQTLYAATVEFNSCTFDAINATAEYSVWTYGVSNVTFSGCTFNNNGKAILVYTEGAHTATINVNNCTFNNTTGKYTDKAAVEVGQSENGKSTYTVNITGSTANGFFANKTSSPLLGNKNTIDYKDLVGIVDGVEITRPDAVVEVTSADSTKVGYPNLADAIAAAKDGDTITLLEDLDLSDWTSVDVSKKITLDGDGNTISGLKVPFINNARTDLTIKDLTFTGANITVTSAAGKDNDTSAAVVVQWHNGGTLTMSGVSVTNSTVNGAGYVAALVGFVDSTAAYTNLNANVSGVSLTAGGTAGTFIGHSYSNGKLTGTVSGNSITSTSDGSTRPDKAGIVVGRTSGGTLDVAVTVGSNTLEPVGTKNSTRTIGSMPGGSILITGGSYPSDPRVTEGTGDNAPTVADGYTIVQAANGMYTLDELPENPDGGYGSIYEKAITKTITIGWDDNNDARGIRPEKVIVTLKGGDIDASLVVEEKDGWTMKLELPAYAEPVTRATGAVPQEITYTVTQDAVSGYTTAYTDGTFTITNTIKPLTVYVSSSYKLLQTGAELLPIGLMVFGGIFAMAAGMWLLRKKSYER